MKKNINLFLILLIFSTAAYYRYLTNENFREYISKLLNFEEQKKNEETTFSPNKKNSKLKKSNKKKIPKTIKPDKFYRIDKYAKETPIQYEKDITTLVQYLIKPAKTDNEKARSLFTWVAMHVKYDDNAYNAGIYPDYTAEYVIKNKKAVCEGYANLLNALCLEAGLKSEKLIGYSKGYGYKIGDKFTETDHAWNAIQIDNKWKLFDATWASGSAINKEGKLKSISEFDQSWYDVDPKIFIFTHLPEQQKWQLIERPLTLINFETLPYLSIDFFNLGFNQEEIFKEVALGNISEFVNTYPTDFPIKVINFPYSNNLAPGKEILFTIESDYAEEIALIEGDSWYNFTKANNTFRITHIPNGKTITICVKINWFDENYSTITKYNFTDKNEITTTPMFIQYF